MSGIELLVKLRCFLYSGEVMRQSLLSPNMPIVLLKVLYQE